MFPVGLSCTLDTTVCLACAVFGLIRPPCYGPAPTSAAHVFQYFALFIVGFVSFMICHLS